MATPRRFLIAIPLVTTAVVALPSSTLKSQESRNRALPGDGSRRHLVRDADHLCTTCVQLEELAVLGDMTGDGFIQWSRVATRDSLGRYWIGQDESLKVYDPAGRFLREVGRRGEGPAEFGRVTFAHTGSDGRVHVLDPRNVRESVFDANFALVEEQRLPGTPASNATASDGVIAAAPRFDYSIEMWDSSGSLLVELRHEESLNEVEDRQVAYNLTDHPMPHEVMAVRFDDADRLWILFRMVRDGWERHYEPHELPGGMAGVRRRPNWTWDSVYESRLDIVDLQSGMVVARSQLPGRFEAFVGDGLLLEYRELPNTVQLAVLRVTIDGR